MIVSSKTPPAIIEKLHEEALKAIASPEVKARLTQLGAEPCPCRPTRSTPTSGPRWTRRRIAKAAHLQAQ
ncbi:MAG: tripartite tricarboxylate transporter substrate-binding protein [Pseudomonadota bacterium]|nr:tripartite tricarboxylate transporter substrate-binding protein [Pseudomonadota bacterium]